jgi:hypothetical protein
MENTAKGAGTPQTLMELVRDPRYTLETRALLLGRIRRFVDASVELNCWAFRHGRDEIVVDEPTLATIVTALSRSAGTKVRVEPKNERTTQCEILTVHGTGREALFQEALGYLAECDVTVLPDQARNELRTLTTAIADAASTVGVFQADGELTLNVSLQLLDNVVQRASVQRVEACVEGPGQRCAAAAEVTGMSKYGHSPQGPRRERSALLVVDSQAALPLPASRPRRRH